MEIEIVILIVTCCYTFVALFIQLDFTKKLNEKDKLLQAVLSSNEEINNHANVTTEVVFTQIMGIYKELSQLLYENYFGMRQIIVEHDRKVSSFDKENYNKLRIYVGANSYALLLEIRKNLAKFEEKIKFLLESLDNEDADLSEGVDELYDIYEEITSSFHKDIERIQTDVR